MNHLRDDSTRIDTNCTTQKKDLIIIILSELVNTKSMKAPNIKKNR